jgi:hypothetical protein
MPYCFSLQIPIKLQEQTSALLFCRFKRVDSDDHKKSQTKEDLRDSGLLLLCRCSGARIDLGLFQLVWKGPEHATESKLKGTGMPASKFSERLIWHPGAE